MSESPQASKWVQFANSPISDIDAVQGMGGVNGYSSLLLQFFSSIPRLSVVLIAYLLFRRRILPKDFETLMELIFFHEFLKTGLISARELIPDYVRSLFRRPAPAAHTQRRRSVRTMGTMTRTNTHVRKSERRQAIRLCEIEGCKREHRARGFCSRHYASKVTRPELRKRRRDVDNQRGGRFIH